MFRTNNSCINFNSNKCNISQLTSQQSLSSIDKLDAQFCGAFQEHYDYIMDKGLIETCQHSSAQVTLMNDYQTMSGNVTFNEFIHQYNELKRWLERMKSITCSGQQESGYCEKYTNQLFYKEILKRSPRRELINEYACHLVKYHPHMKKDVLFKLNFLNDRWKSIEFSIISRHLSNENITNDLEQDLKNFEIWLKRVEELVKNLTVCPNWSLSDIKKCLSDHKFLQSDIEAHAKIINSVLKLSTKLKQSYIDCSKLNETGLYLQNKWHCVWLMSLEWQCRLEQELSRKKKIDLDLSGTPKNKDPITQSAPQLKTYKTSLILSRSSVNLKSSKEYKTKKIKQKTDSFSRIESLLTRRSIATLQFQELNVISNLSDSLKSEFSAYPKDRFKIKQDLKNFRNKSRSKKTIRKSASPRRKIRRKYSLNKKFKRYLNDLMKIERPLASFKEYNSEFITCKDDIIPFDESEYERIISSSSTTTFPENYDKIDNQKISADKNNYRHLYSQSLNSLSINSSEGLFQMQNNLINNNSMDTIESFSNVLVEDFLPTKLKKDHFKNVIKMKNSRTESEISSKKRKIFALFRSRHTYKPHHQFNALKNDASYYYSLTDVNYYNIDDKEDDQNIFSTVSSNSTSSLSSSGCLTSSSAQNNSHYDQDRSCESDNYQILHKSSTSPKIENTFGFKQTEFLEEEESSEKKFKIRPIGSKKNKSFSDYFMSHLSVKSEKHNRKQIKRRRRFFTGVVQPGEISKNGNEADDEEKFDEPVLAKDDDLASENQSVLNYNNTTNSIAPSLGETLASTVNTDVSWDGYTETPFYKNSITTDNQNIKKAQPVLPWDELFFELDPPDDTHNIGHANELRSNRSVENFLVKSNVNTGPSTEKRKKDTVISEHHFHHYHHHHHHYNSRSDTIKTRPDKLTCSKEALHINDLAETNHKIAKRNHSQDSFTSSENTSSTSGRFSYISSSNSPNDITSNFENEYALLSVNTSLNTNEGCYLNNSFKTDTDLEELEHLINDSLNQWANSYSLYIELNSALLTQKQIDLMTEYSSAELGNKSSLLTSSLKIYDLMSVENKLKKMNEISVACRTNVNFAEAMKNSILERKKSEEDLNKTKSSIYNLELKKMSYYIHKLDETIIKWKMLDSIVADNNKGFNIILNILNDLKSIRNRICIINNVYEQIISFESITEIKRKLIELEENKASLKLIQAEINTQRHQLKEILNKEINQNVNVLQEILEEIKDVEKLQLKNCVELDTKIKSINDIYFSWSLIDQIAAKLKNDFEKYYAMLNSCKSKMSVTYDLYGTRIENQNICFDETDIQTIVFDVNEFKDNLGKLRNELDRMPYLVHSTFYNSYSLLLDRFYSNIKILNEIYTKNSNEKQIKTSDLRSFKDDNLNQVLQQKKIYNLDFRSDDNIQFDLRPDQLSTPRTNNLKCTEKMYSDKAVATEEKNTAMTEINCDDFETNEADLQNINVQLNVKNKTQSTKFDDLLSKKTSKNKENLDIISHKKINEYIKNGKKAKWAYLRRQVMQENVVTIDNRKTGKSQNSLRKFKNIFMILLVILFLIFLLGFCFANLHLVSRCCDYSRSFLIFNTKVYSEDGPLPF